MRTIRVPDHLGAFFRARTLEGHFESGGTGFDVRIEVPDLRGLDATCWGDWGPMYGCQLPADRRVQITYLLDDGRQAIYRFNPGTLRVHSPSRLRDRLETPFYLEVEDLAHGVQIRAFMDNQGRVARLQFQRLHLQHDLAELLLGTYDSTPIPGDHRKAV